MNYTIGVFVGLFIAAVVIGLVVSFPVMLLWNGCLVGAIDGIHEITWLQTWGILVLSSCLFKNNPNKGN